MQNNSLEISNFSDFNETRLVTSDSNFPHDTEKWFFNLTNLDIPSHIVDIVKLGPKYSQKSSIDKSLVLETIKNTEFFLNSHSLSSDIKTSVRSIITDELKSRLNKTDHISKEDRFFSKKLMSITKYFKDKKIMFTMADKGASTGAISTIDYKNKMLLLLSDETNYKVVNENPLKKLQSDTKSFLQSWNNKKYFYKGLEPIKYHRFKFSQTDTMLSRIYGLPKIHKLGYPLRPVVSSISSPIYFLSQQYDQMLKNSISKPKSHIKKSFDLIEKLKNIVVPEDHILISIDVTSLYTNVSEMRVIESIKKRYSDISKIYKIPLNEIVKGVKLIMKSTYFSFDRKFYHQIYGLPMGGPCSTIFADMVLDDLETECLGLLDFTPVVFFRYVDDIFIIVPKNKVDSILQVFNSYDNRLQFTHEVENENSISFLDLLIIQKEGRIITNWYQKPTFSGRMLNYNSEHPFTHKKGVIFNLVDRAILLSHPSFHRQNIKNYKSQKSFKIKWLSKQYYT